MFPAFSLCDYLPVECKRMLRLPGSPARGRRHVAGAMGGHGPLGLPGAREEASQQPANLLSFPASPSVPM